MPAGLLLWAALAAAQPTGEPLSEAHKAPYESLAGRTHAGSDRQETLAEMWQRGILTPEARSWGPENLLLLTRMRRAEAAGAIDQLRSRGAAAGGFISVLRRAGEIVPRARLTRAGYERYRLLRTQDALAYFDTKGVETKWAFRLRDMEGKPLFEADGKLSEAGEAVYQRARANLAVHWQDAYGRIYGTRAPPAASSAAPAPAPSAPARRTRAPRLPEAPGASGRPATGAERPGDQRPGEPGVEL